MIHELETKHIRSQSRMKLKKLLLMGTMNGIDGIGDFESPVKSKVLTPQELSSNSDAEKANLDLKSSPSKHRKAFIPKGINLAKKKIRKKKPMTIKEPIDTDEESGNYAFMFIFR
jgi:hypothetical protein